MPWKKKHRVRCVDCDRSFFALASQRLRCDECAVLNRRKRQNEQKSKSREPQLRAEQRRERIASGKCEHCTRPPREGKTLCLECSEKINARWVKRYRLKQEQERQREREAVAAKQAAYAQRLEEAEKRARKEEFDQRWRRLVS